MLEYFSKQIKALKKEEKERHETALGSITDLEKIFEEISQNEELIKKISGRGLVIMGLPGQRKVKAFLKKGNSPSLVGAVKAFLSTGEIVESPDDYSTEFISVCKALIEEAGFRVESIGFEVLGVEERSQWADVVKDY